MESHLAVLAPQSQSFPLNCLDLVTKIGLKHMLQSAGTGKEFSELLSPVTTPYFIGKSIAVNTYGKTNCVHVM